MDQLNKVHKNIKEFILKLNENSISKKRLKILDKIINALNKNTLNKNYPNIIFVCTHNSRRSQIAEIWAHTFSFIFKKKIEIFSAGTIKEEFNIRAINVLKKIGFKIKKEAKKYILNFSENYNSIHMYSKHINELDLKNHFITIMTCSDSDKNCPAIPNALGRVLLSYEDPKSFDNTKQETNKYKATSKKIALEFFYLFKKLNGKNGKNY